MPLDPSSAGARVHAARVQAGLSQEALARATGLSRQAIGAIEGGRHRPGVDAALALAGALGLSVEALFGTPGTEDSVSVFGDAVAEGTPVLTSRVGRRRVHAPADLAGWQERWPVADARWTAGEVRPLGATADDGLVVVGCDPALSLIAAQLPSTGPRRIVAVSGSTRAALAALQAGRAHAALVHGRPDALPPAPAGVRRLHLARWRVGLATASTARPLSLTALTGAGTDVVQRETGASSQQALLRALDTEGCAPVTGPIAGGHLAVVMRVAAGARAGVTMEPAAVHGRLGFLPLEEHAVELWIASEHRDHPAVDALGGVLVSRTLHARLAAIGGYDLTGCGSSVEDRP
jgi:transcriptional regulator with XRE-family HTH domain